MESEIARRPNQWYSIRNKCAAPETERERTSDAAICEYGAGPAGPYETAAYQLLSGDQPEGPERGGGAYAGGPSWAGPGEAP